MSWRNLEGNHENSGDGGHKADWLPPISDYEPDEVVCVAGKNPDPEKIFSCCMRNKGGGDGCPNLVPIAMIEAKPEEVIGRRRHQPNLEKIRCQLGI